MQMNDVAKLRYFSSHELDYQGKAVQWADYYVVTMGTLDALRYIIGAPIILIRGSHGEHKGSCVDWCCPGADYGRVVLETTRTRCFGIGFYEGGSVHVDYTDSSPDGTNRRWLAFKPETGPVLEAIGMPKQEPINGWLYMPWSHDSSFEALTLLVRINNNRRTHE